MQMCLGATYAWSVFVLPIKQASGILQAAVQLPFSLFYFAFPATMIITGTLLPRVGPRRCAVIGGALFGGGWLLASLGNLDFTYTVIGIGPLAGIGVGFAYIVPIATCVRWFPRQKGLVTGIAVAGFGGGAALVSQIAGRLMTDMAMSPYETFRLLGMAFLGLVCVAGMFMENPREVHVADGQRLTMGKILTRRAFVSLYLGMMAGLAAGFAVNANIKELFAGASVEAGVGAVALFALANAAGRISWGWIFDRFRSIRVLQINLLLQAGMLFLSAAVLRSETGLAVFAVFSGFNYGGILVLYASAAAQMWGSHRLSQVYGWLFSANIPAAVSPIVAGMAFDHSGTFIPVLSGIGGLMVGGIFVLGRCDKEEKK